MQNAHLKTKHYNMALKNKSRYFPYDIVQRCVRPVVFFEDGDYRRVFKESAHGLILAEEADANQTIPLAKVYGRCRVFRLDPHHARFYLGRRPEIVLTDLNVGQETD